MMFKPRCPSAGPIGGLGFALPAGTCSLMNPIIFFATSFSWWVQTDAFHALPGSVFRSQTRNIEWWQLRPPSAFC
jgi:hypothetical protein